MERLKVLLGIRDTSEDELLRLILDETEDYILSYCRIEAIPEKLESLVSFMAADLYRHKCYGTNSLPMNVKSISEGERSVTYETPNYSEDIFKNYQKRLNSYRRARVPSEVMK